MKKQREEYGFIFTLAGMALGVGLARKVLHGSDKAGDKMPKASSSALHVEQYRLDDGTLVTGRQNAKLATANDIVQSVTPFTYLAPGLFSGIATRETKMAINEVDTDYKSDGSLLRTTYGIFQSNNPGDEYSLAKAVKNFSRDMESIMRQIAKAAKFDLMHPPRDAYAYAAWGHNAGPGEPVESINKYKMDWNTTIKRNQDALMKDPGNKGAEYMVKKMIPYAQEVLRHVDLYPAKLKVV